MPVNLTFKAKPEDNTLPPLDGILDLDISDNKFIDELPAGLHLMRLKASHSQLCRLPDDIQVDLSIDLSNCEKLEYIPDNLSVGSLNLADCENLPRLPDHLHVKNLNISRCNFSEWPEDLSIEFGSLILSNCPNLTTIPKGLHNVTFIDIDHCSQITTIPEEIYISGPLNIRFSGLKELPPHLDNVQLMWGFVPISPKTAFHADELSKDEIINEPNVELRRAIIEKIGYERFFEIVSPTILDSDNDPGGPRKLLKIDLEEDEPIIVLAVNCPSTQRKYMLRVPPTITSCHQAAAWIAGFDDPNDYHPEIET